ncbi:hypothetical protein E0H75_21320 [Kribbella capetownensis]|uniref:Twin-arginine translocation signal domain-containing protein n=1 Tax=Kribbella capetownensis TaxID=1572659 RepID=A0A4R0JP85_9ACTN|nr:hypothetical protein [Kribbella capetownensis]TCC49081.1 hypothetical protein E0H75_21320 [Kribbella capetownensis]
MLPRAARTAMNDETPHQRQGLGRRHFMFGAAGLTGTAVGGGWLAAPAASAQPAQNRHLSTAAARHIPGGFQLVPGGELYHVFFPGQGEPSTITDFKGKVAAAVIDGRGTGANAAHAFEVDVRFMDGTFIGLDGRQSVGTFTFY